MAHILFGYINIYCQYNYNPTKDIQPQAVLTVVIVLSMMKTFFFMRIIERFSYIVTMIMNVVKDLQTFMIFFTILIVKFSLILDVLGIDGAEEYQTLPPMFKSIISTLRLTLGDFEFEILSEHLSPEQRIMYWISWVVMFFLGTLIFLNFIIAEVSSSYEDVKAEIDALIYKERAKLIKESEDFMSKKEKETNKSKFPKYVIIREMEN